MSTVHALLPASQIEFAPTQPATAARVSVDGKYFARGGRRFRLNGVTYGPFAPNSLGEHFPCTDRVREDFAQMREINVNTIRTYYVPPEWFLEEAAAQEMAVFVDVPWAKHLCFLSSKRAMADARRAVRDAVERGRCNPTVLGYSICNEISPSVVRWHGARHIERFLAELADIARQADPDTLVTYANYPPTEYLDLSFLDFFTFNVYLHDVEKFRKYMYRLQHIVGDKPLMLGELGMDTLRHGEMEQAHFLKGHLQEGILMGLAGAFVFSWTDDWYTGGHQITDWGFGITKADRSPKPAYHALREVFEVSPMELLAATPRVSVVVCSYNGGSTLRQCLESLERLDYPDYEVIVVDDGSTDNTRAILADFPNVRAIHQPNCGLSVARNVGLQAATGSIVAYTDSDCFADAHWLTHLVYHFQKSTAAAVGGPNLTPEDGRLAACVAAAPGQPTHVLESDQVAEHIPGCNMAFRREALLAINGFEPIYRKAGDDVDVCWRLQQAGYWISFAPGAFVWHHRRQNPRAYLKQQAGYGEAEALLSFQHPDRFNGRGDGKWRGVVYGNALNGLRLGEAMIYRGTFGAGLFQCLYEPGPAHWAMLPATLEWHLAAGVVAAAGFLWMPAWIVTACMLLTSLLVAGLQALQAPLAARHSGFSSRLVVFGLCYLQPLVRSWARYRTRIFSYSPPQPDPIMDSHKQGGLPLSGYVETAYWSEDGKERTELLEQVVSYLTVHRWGKTLDSGWSNWDIEIYCHPWTVVQLCTAQEEHGGNRRLIRVRYQLRRSGYTQVLQWAAALAAIIAIGLLALPALFEVGILVGVCAGIWAFCLGAWWRGTRQAKKAMAVVDAVARSLNMLPVAPARKD